MERLCIGYVFEDRKIKAALFCFVSGQQNRAHHGRQRCYSEAHPHEPACCYNNGCRGDALLVVFYAASWWLPSPCTQPQRQDQQGVPQDHHHSDDIRHRQLRP